MQQAVSGRTPVHLWIVGLIALALNGFGCFQYLMTTLRNPEFMAKIPPEQVAFMDGLPGWVTGCWALGVWGGLAGAILLLMRSRYAILAFAISLFGAVAGFGYQIFVATRPESMTAGAMAMIPWLIILFCAFLVWYSMDARKKGLLG